MTAFANAERQFDGWTFAWEARSVNHRYLDVALRLPDAYRFIEAEARRRVAVHVKRGRLDVNLAMKTTGQGAAEIQVNPDIAEALLNAARQVEALCEKPLASFSALDILRWPGVLHEAETDREALAEAVLGLLDEAMGKIATAREKEGAQLAELIESRCLRMREHVYSVRARMPQVLAGLRQKTLARIAEVTSKPDAERLEQELVYLAQKLDVAEELDRLDAHLGETLATLRSSEPAGRRLDFLLQEMNREANTLGSKSADIDTTRASVEMKVLIEQMREQIQNIE